MLLNLTPGNDMIYAASRTISQGTRSGILSALGVFAGCFVHISAAVLGLSIIIVRSPTLFGVVKNAGAVYIIYLGVKSFMNKVTLDDKPDSFRIADGARLFRQGLMTNAMNPKVAIFFLSFLPQFVNPASSSVKLQLLTLGIWFDAQGALVLIMVALLLGRTANLLKRNEKLWEVQRKATGVVLVGLGLKLAMAARR